jgi:hypothetical protein
MVGVIWVLVSLLIGALMAATVLYGRNRRLDNRISERDRTIVGLRGDLDYWVRQSENYRARYLATDAGLSKVQALATGKMANVGHRMYQAAATAQRDAKRLPFDKV